MKNILIVSSSHEAYYHEPFVGPCRELGVSLCLFDTGKFPSETKFHLVQRKDAVVEGWLDITRLSEDGHGVVEKLEVADIHGAWHLRPVKPTVLGAQTVLEAKFSENEARAALSSMASVLPCPWVNHRESVRRIEGNKLLQQDLAIKTGLAVPETVITNDPESAGGFASGASNGQVLLKTLTTTELDKEGKYFIFSQIFTEDEINGNPESIQNCPVFAQAYVPKAYEYRVYCVGNEVLACRIHSQKSEKTLIDWRHYDFDHVPHEECKLPQEVSEKILRFMELADLRYGAIDLIETPGGEFVFLEVNPSGQWGWIQHYAGLDIPGAVARMLVDL